MSLSRQEQVSLFNTLTGNLTINTSPDGSGSDETVSVDVHWGFEPVELQKASIIVTVSRWGQPILRTLGDAWEDIPSEGIYSGYLARIVLNVKVRAFDQGNGDDGDFISKIDIAQALMERVHEQAFLYWDDLIYDGGVEKGGIKTVHDISHILRMVEQEQVLQLDIYLQKLHKKLPVEPGIKYSTAPTILALELETTIES